MAPLVESRAVTHKILHLVLEGRNFSMDPVPHRSFTIYYQTHSTGQKKSTRVILTGNLKQLNYLMLTDH